MPLWDFPSKSTGVGCHCLLHPWINLLFFLPTAFVALLLHAKNRCVVWSVAIPAAVAGCLAGGLLAWFAAGLNSGILRYAFGTYLLATGMWELLSALRKTEYD